MKFNPLEFKIFRLLERERDHKLLVAVSGGADSVALLVLLKKLQPRLNLVLTVGHVHHGKTSSKVQTKARDQAFESVRALAKKFDLPLVSNDFGDGTPVSQSEADLRKFRHDHLEKMRIVTGSDSIVFAHHADDLFETRLLRLLRGTGPQGLKAMRVRSKNKLRPLLGVSRKSLRAYLETSGVSATEDPSNQSSAPLRNWLRHVWLVELERKRPGASQALARSLSLLAEAVSFSESETPSLKKREQDGIDRRNFDALSAREKRSTLVVYLRELDAQNMGRTQIEEVIKRLDTDQKSLEFEVGPLKWSINAQQISAVWRTKSAPCR